MIMFGVRVWLSHDGSGDGDGSNDDDDGDDVMTVMLIKMMVVGWWDWSK